MLLQRQQPVVAVAGAVALALYSEVHHHDNEVGGVLLLHLRHLFGKVLRYLRGLDSDVPDAVDADVFPAHFEFTVIAKVFQPLFLVLCNPD